MRAERVFDESYPPRPYSKELAIETYGEENIEVYQSYFKPLVRAASRVASCKLVFGNPSYGCVNW